MESSESLPDAEREASEVLHSLLPVERIEKRIDDGLDQSDELLDVETINSLIKSEIQDDDIVDVELSDEDEIPILDRFKTYHAIHSLTKKKKKKRSTANKTSKPKSEPSTKPKTIKTTTTTTTPTAKTSTIAKRTKKPNDNNETTSTTLECSVIEVNARLVVGCECQGSCFRDLQADSVYRHRLNIAELTKQEHDMYLMGVTMACLANRTETNRHKERIRQRASYVFQGKRVCLDAFLYLENVTHYHLKRIRRHVMINGVIPRVHGNMRKKPHNALSLDLYKFAEHFVKNELQRYKPDIHKGNLVINEPRINLYQKFRTECISQGKTMSYSTFRHFLKKQFPNVRFVLNRSDGYGAANRDKYRFPKREKSHPKSKNLKTKKIFMNNELDPMADGGDIDGCEDEYLDEYDTETVSDAEPIENDGNGCIEFGGNEIDSFDDSEMNEADDNSIEEIYEDVDFLESEDE